MLAHRPKACTASGHLLGVSGLTADSTVCAVLEFRSPAVSALADSESPVLAVDGALFMSAAGGELALAISAIESVLPADGGETCGADLAATVTMVLRPCRSNP